MKRHIVLLGPFALAPKATMSARALPLAEALVARGHRVALVEKVAGGMTGVLVDQAGLLHGAACWRADGSPGGLSGGPARLAGESLPLGEWRG